MMRLLAAGHMPPSRRRFNCGSWGCDCGCACNPDSEPQTSTHVGVLIRFGGGRPSRRRSGRSWGRPIPARRILRSNACSPIALASSVFPCACWPGRITTAWSPARARGMSRSSPAKRRSCRPRPAGFPAPSRRCRSTARSNFWRSTKSSFVPIRIAATYSPTVSCVRAAWWRPCSWARKPSASCCKDWFHTRSSRRGPGCPS